MAAKRILATVFLLLGAAVASAQSARSPKEAAQDFSAPDDSTNVIEVKTDTPRDTLTSLLRLRSGLEVALGDYRQQQDKVNAARIGVLIDQLISLIDVSDIPVAKRVDAGMQTALCILDIVGRIKPIDVDDLPGMENFVAADDQSLASFPLPGTPLRIVEMPHGPRTGEFLFSTDAVQTAPRFAEAIRTRPLRTTLSMTSWTDEFAQLTGPWIPMRTVQNLPGKLQQPLLDNPIWKILLTVWVFVVTGLALRALHLLSKRFFTDSPSARIRLSLISPIGVMVAVNWLDYVVSHQIVVREHFFDLTAATITVFFYSAAAWAFKQACTVFFETVIIKPKRPSNLDDDFVRLLGRFMGIVGAIIVLGYGAQRLGVPVLTITAGLGLSGFAVALAIRPTLENLIGGFILYIDQPVRVGDYCSFSDRSGFVEAIGVRSTKLRALDRTLISVPNSKFVDMQITNWAKCDTMLIDEVLGVRFETDAEQLRHVLGKIREMLMSHPRIESDTIRVRFDGFGESSLNILLRIYAMTREWNDYYAIREDVLLRIIDIVEASGTAFAFPSRTVYWARDPAWNTEKTEQAHEEVARWRRQRELPFPRFSERMLRSLRGRVQYPPRGSPDYLAKDDELKDGGERLSADVPADEDEETAPDKSADKSTD